MTAVETRWVKKMHATYCKQVPDSAECDVWEMLAEQRNLYESESGEVIFRSDKCRKDAGYRNSLGRKEAP